tara:strand:+ start:258 stop:773 length:516 start_codon:yes stop_codon:yes gene_type:complete
MSPSISKNFRESPEYKDLNCGTCNSILPPPGFFCVQCGPPEGPLVVIEGKLTLLKTIIRITLLIFLFLIISVFKLDINIIEIFPINKDEKQMKLAEDEDFKIIFKVNAAVANIRNLPNMKTSKIIDSIPIGTHVMVNGVDGDWSKIKYSSGPNAKLNAGWIATRLLDSKIK